MDKLKEILQDPTWWVTVVFVGLIVSTAAGFLKEFISKILSSFSSKFRSWKTERDRKFDLLVEHLSKDIGLILYKRIQALLMLLLWCTLIILMLISYLFYKLVEQKTIFFAAIVTTSIFSFLPYFLSMYYLRLSGRSKSKYQRNKRTIPNNANAADAKSRAAD